MRRRLLTGALAVLLFTGCVPAGETETELSSTFEPSPDRSYCNFECTNLSADPESPPVWGWKRTYEGCLLWATCILPPAEECYLDEVGNTATLNCYDD